MTRFSRHSPAATYRTLESLTAKQEGKGSQAANRTHPRLLQEIVSTTK